MNRFTRLLVIASLFPLFSFAQSNFKPGYVVTLKGDTIKGLIDLKDALYPKEITFEEEPGSAGQLFIVNDIKAFRVNNIVSYLKYAGNISADKTDISKISIGRDVRVNKVVVFLKQELEGANVDLYSYTDNTKTRYFIKGSREEQPVELMYRVYYTSGQNSSTKSEEGFKAQLLEIANEYGTNKQNNLLDEIEQSKYNVSDLRAVIRKINNTTVSEHSELPVASFFVGVGLNSTSFKPDGNFLLLNARSHTSIFPQISIGINIYPNPAVGKLFLRGTFSFTRNSYITDIDVYTDNRPLSKSSYGFNQYVYAFSPQIQYNLYNADDFKFYINGGVSINISSYTGNSIHNNYTDQTTENVSNAASVWLSTPVKAGIILGKKVDVAITYVLPTRSVANVKATSFQAGIGYIF